jgi:hypothetical protein
VTRYFTQWDDATIAGGLPVGLDAALAGRRSNPANVVPDVVYKRLIVKRRALSYKEVASNFPGAITYDALDTDANRANIEILTAVKVDRPRPRLTSVLWTRGSGTTPAPRTPTARSSRSPPRALAEPGLTW